MTKLEYLEKLENILKKSMPQKEVNDIVRDYAEYFEEGKRQDKSDSEISAKLGNPEVIAEQILEENGYDIKKVKINLKDKFRAFGNRIKNIRFSNLVKISLSILLITVLLPLEIAAIVFIFAVAFFVVCVVIGLSCLSVIMLIAAVCVLIASGLAFSILNPISGIFTVVIAIGLLTLGLCLLGLTLLLCKGTWILFKNMFFSFCKALNKKQDTIKLEEGEINEQA